MCRSLLVSTTCAWGSALLFLACGEGGDWSSPALSSLPEAAGEVVGARGWLDIALLEEDGTSEVRFYLRAPDGSRLRLLNLGSEGLLPNTPVRVDGWRTATELWVESLELERQPAPPPPASLAAAPLVRTLHGITVGFRDHPTYASAEELRPTYFDVPGSVAEVYREMSYGLLTFTGDVFVLNVSADMPRETETCDRICVAGAVETLARQELPSAFDANYISLVSSAISGSFAFVGSPGAFAGGTAYGASVQHELGHVMGLNHAGAWNCSPEVYYAYPSANCDGWQYGPYSLMGASAGHFSAYQKTRLGWLAPSSTTNATAGVYALAPLEVPSALPQALVVGSLYIEHRRPIGADVWVPEGLMFRTPLALWSQGYGYTEEVLLKTEGTHCYGTSCNYVLTKGRVFREAGVSDPPLHVVLLEVFPEAAMVQVHRGVEPPLAISDVRVTGIGVSSATVEWTTAVASTSQVEYGSTYALGQATSPALELVTQHRVRLTGLSPAAPVFFRVASVTGATSGYGYGRFTTLGDVAPPTVSILAPAAGAVVRGETVIRIAASDDMLLASVDVVVDETLLATGGDSLNDIGWSTSEVADGPHRLGAIVRDRAGNRAEAWIDVVVDNAPIELGDDGMDVPNARRVGPEAPAMRGGSCAAAAVDCWALALLLAGARLRRGRL